MIVKFSVMVLADHVLQPPIDVFLLFLLLFVLEVMFSISVVHVIGKTEKEKSVLFLITKMIKGQFHQPSTSSFYSRRSQKRNKAA